MTLAEMLTILSGTYLSAHFLPPYFSSTLEIFVTSSRRHPESIPKGGGCSLSRILCGSCSHHPPKLLPSCSQLSAGNKGGGREHVKTDKKSVSYTCVASFFNPFMRLLSVLTVPAALLRMRGISASLMPIWKRIRKNML